MDGRMDERIDRWKYGWMSVWMCTQGIMGVKDKDT